MVRDLWKHEDLGIVRGDFSTRVDGHDVAAGPYHTCFMNVSVIQHKIDQKELDNE